jgi:hypothetical protein
VLGERERDCECGRGRDCEDVERGDSSVVNSERASVLLVGEPCSVVAIFCLFLPISNHSMMFLCT